MATIGNQNALALLTKGLAFGDPLFKGMLIVAGSVTFGDGEIVIIKTGGGSNLAANKVTEIPDIYQLKPLDTDYYSSERTLERIKKIISDKNKKVKEISLTIEPKEIDKNIKISAQQIESNIKASLLKENYISEKEKVKIRVKLLP